jgi:hypothetical protein
MSPKQIQKSLKNQYENKNNKNNAQKFKMAVEFKMTSKEFLFFTQY